MSDGIFQSQSAIGSSLLEKDEPSAFSIMNADGKTPCILVCDHASNLVPRKLGTLGMTEDDLQQHYAVDIGVKKITEVMSEALDAPAVFGNYSRLVVDLNRDIQHPTTFVMTGEGKPVPGNIAMNDADKQLRIDELYNPFHDALSSMIDGYLDKGIVPAVIAIHSFTPVFYNQRRPWEVGVLWVQDDRIPAATIKHFENLGYCVGDNEPYDARYLRGTTVNRHADARHLPNALVEVRNDLISTDKDSIDWANRLVECYNPILSDENLYTLYEGPIVEHDPEEERTYFEKLVEKAKKGDGDE